MVFPPRAEDYVDRRGTPRKVGGEEYKNRLMAFIESNTPSQSSLDMEAGQMERLAAWLDSVYEKTCKGVHVDVTPTEARLALIHTYMVVADVAAAAERASLPQLA